MQRNSRKQQKKQWNKRKKEDVKVGRTMRKGQKLLEDRPLFHLNKEEVVNAHFLGEF